MHLHANGFQIALDDHKGDISFVSHAHADHVSNSIRKKERIIASDETIDLAGLRGKKVEIDGVKLLGAGHILGSRQLFVENDGYSTVYTGDISVKPNIITPGAEIPQCDHLIMETTYAKPDYKFPDYFEVVDEIAEWVKSNHKSNIIIGCYEMGKAQEMIKILNEYCGIAPIVKERTEKISSIYEKHGVKLDRILVGTDEAEEVMNKRFVALVPMRQAKRYFASRLTDAFGKKTVSASVTGWALHYRLNVDAAFPLSDHADFYDLKYYVEQSGAKEVEFFEGDGSKLLQAVSPLLARN